jgi:hypothetical protein
MIVYSNGDSYSAYNPDIKKYCDFLGDKLNCQVINSAIPGSCNDRILRTSIRDLMSLQKKHKDIVAVISLSFTIRSELWLKDHSYSKWKNSNDGDFFSCQFTLSHDWFNDKNKKVVNDIYKQYAKQWLNWFNIEAETTKLLHQLVLLTSWLKTNKIKYVILSSALQEPVDFTSPFISSFYDELINDSNILNIFEQSFTEWCNEHGFAPINDYLQSIHGKTYIIGHRDQLAHQAFAEYLLENYIKVQL